jgi:Lrp/AsnC family transcriptional regulator, leucine-responsive regulatory protein
MGRKPASRPHIRMKPSTAAIDTIDAAILNQLQSNNRITTDALAMIVGLSPTACQRRMKRLRKTRVIEGDVSIVSPKAVGRRLAMMVLVSLERERTDIIDRFKQAIRSTPEVMSGYYVTGEADFVLIITSTDMEEFEDFTRRFFYKNQDIKRFKTLVIMDRVKAGFFVPVEATD